MKMTNSNGGATAARENLERFFVEWEDKQRVLARDQRNAVAYFVKELVAEYNKAMADHIKRFDTLRDEKLELQRQLEMAQRELNQLNLEIEQREFFGTHCNWLNTCSADGFWDNLVDADCGLRMDYSDYVLNWRYPRCPKCGRLINFVGGKPPVTK